MTSVRASRCSLVVMVTRRVVVTWRQWLPTVVVCRVIIRSVLRPSGHCIPPRRRSTPTHWCSAAVPRQTTDATLFDAVYSQPAHVFDYLHCPVLTSSLTARSTTSAGLHWQLSAVSSSTTVSTFVHLLMQRAILTVQFRPSPSVCPSVTLRCCVKMAKDIVEILSPSDSPVISVTSFFTKCGRGHP